MLETIVDASFRTASCIKANLTAGLPQYLGGTNIIANIFYDEMQIKISVHSVSSQTGVKLPDEFSVLELIQVLTHLSEKYQIQLKRDLGGKKRKKILPIWQPNHSIYPFQ